MSHADPAPPQPAHAETVHACPPDGSGLTPCCHRTPLELPRGERITNNCDAVTCTTAAPVLCSATVLRQPHSAHDWTPQPGMTPVRCTGYASAQQPTPPTPAPAPVDEALVQRVHAALRAVGEGDTDPGTGSDYGDQTAAVLAELAPELARTPLICSDERHQTKVAALEAAIARVRAQCAEWARPIKSGTWDARIRDDIAAACAWMILRALDGPAPDTDRPPQ